jgi:hypothetical protein
VLVFVDGDHHKVFVKDVDMLRPAFDSRVTFLRRGQILVVFNWVWLLATGKK